MAEQTVIDRRRSVRARRRRLAAIAAAMNPAMSSWLALRADRVPAGQKVSSSAPPAARARWRCGSPALGAGQIIAAGREESCSRPCPSSAPTSPSSSTTTRSARRRRRRRPRLRLGPTRRARCPRVTAAPTGQGARRDPDRFVAGPTAAFPPPHCARRTSGSWAAAKARCRPRHRRRAAGAGRGDLRGHPHRRRGPGPAQRGRGRVERARRRPAGGRLHARDGRQVQAGDDRKLAHTSARVRTRTAATSSPASPSVIWTSAATSTSVGPR